MWWPRRPHVYSGSKHTVELAVDGQGKMPALDDLEREIPDLNESDDSELISMQAAIEHYADNGFHNVKPTQARPLRERLWEFKGRAVDGLRLLFFFDGRRIVLLSAFRKSTQKTPDQQINRAARLKEIESLRARKKAPKATTTTTMTKSRRKRRRGGRR